MRTLRNLPLAVRLGGAFGLVAVLLVAISVLGVTRMRAVQHHVDDLADNEMRAAALIADMKEGMTGNVAGATQHLYVYDGDLEHGDALARSIAADMAEGDKAGPEIAALVKGTSAAGP